MRNNKKTTLKILIIFLVFVFLICPFRPAEAFWSFKKKPNSVPSDELTLILELGRKSLVEEMGGALREGGICEVAVLELALGKLIELTQAHLLNAAWKTFLAVEKMLLGGASKAGAEAWDIFVKIGEKVALEKLGEKMDEQKKKEKDEKVILSGKTNSGCDYKMSVDWFKKEKRVHVTMEGDCYCKEQLTGPTKYEGTTKPLSKFKVEFDIDYHYEAVEYEIDGNKKRVLGYAGGIRTKEGPYSYPFENIGQIWYEGMNEKEGECGCKDGKPLKTIKVSVKPGITPDSRLAFVDSALEKAGMFFAFSPQRKAEKALVYAEEKLAEIIAMADIGDFLAIKKASDRYEYFINTAWRESEKIKGEQKDNIIALTDKTFLDHKEIIEEIVSKNSAKFNTEEELKRMKALLTLLNKLASKKEKEMEMDKIEKIKKEESVREDTKKEESKKDIKKTEPKQTKEAPPQPKAYCGDGKINQPSEECDPPLLTGQCGELGGICDDICQCRYQDVKDICGDGKITGLELCDGNLFSERCWDSVKEYQIVYNNPDLFPKCFNNCRGCEASANRE